MKRGEWYPECSPDTWHQLRGTYGPADFILADCE